MNQAFLGPGSPRTSEPEAYALLFDRFRLEPVSERFWRGDERVALKPLTFQVLRYLVEHPQRLVSKQELLGTLWSDVNVSDAVLKVQINEIPSARRASVSSRVNTRSAAAPTRRPSRTSERLSRRSTGSPTPHGGVRWSSTFSSRSACRWS